MPPMVVVALAQVNKSFSLCPRVHGFLRLLRSVRRSLLVVVPWLHWFLDGCGGSCAASRDGGSSACGSPCDCLVRLGVGGKGDDDLASVVSNPWLWINSLFSPCLLSRVSSAPPLAPWSDFASLFVLSTPESHRPPSISLPRLLWLRVLIRQAGGGGGGGVCAASGSPSRIPAPSNFRC